MLLAHRVNLGGFVKRLCEEQGWHWCVILGQEKTQGWTEARRKEKRQEGK